MWVRIRFDGSGNDPEQSGFLAVKGWGQSCERGLTLGMGPESCAFSPIAPPYYRSRNYARKGRTIPPCQQLQQCTLINLTTLNPEREKQPHVTIDHLQASKLSGRVRTSRAIIIYTGKQIRSVKTSVEEDM